MVWFWLLGVVAGVSFSSIFWLIRRTNDRELAMLEYIEHHKTKATLRLVEAEYRQLSKGLYAILKGEHLE
jgi:hypothetical protein